MIKTLHFSTSTNVFATSKAHGDKPTKIRLKQKDTLTHGDNVYANKLIFSERLHQGNPRHEEQNLKLAIEKSPDTGSNCCVNLADLNSNPRSIVQNHTTHF